MNNNFLTKTAEFIKLSLDSLSDLQEKLYEQRKQAMIQDLDREKYRVALQKAADALYDTDFITDEQEKRVFLRKAAADPVYVVRTLEKLANASDVAQMGRPAKVTARNKEADFDPVWQACFGSGSNSGIIDD